MKCTSLVNNAEEIRIAPEVRDGPFLWCLCPKQTGRGQHSHVVKGDQTHHIHNNVFHATVTLRIIHNVTTVILQRQLIKHPSKM